MKKSKLNVTREQYLGARMANVLFAIANHQHVDPKTADKLYKMWDSITDFRINNPFVSIELEKQLFPENKQ
jgi:hypothetical protein